MTRLLSELPISQTIFDAEEKIDAAFTSLAENRFADAIYHTYSAGIHTAKALLLDQKVHCNTQSGIIADFDKHLEEKFSSFDIPNFADFILQINKYEPSKEFAQSYYSQVNNFISKAKEFRM